MGSTPKSRRLSRRERKELSRREQNRKLRLVKPSAVQSARRVMQGKVKTFALAAGGTALEIQTFESDAESKPSNDTISPSSGRRLSREAGQPMNAANLHICEKVGEKNLVAAESRGTQSDHTRSATAEDASGPSESALRLARNLTQEWEDEFLAVLEEILTDLAARERKLRERSRQEKPLKDDLDLLGFGYRLWMSRFNANADEVLGKFVLGKDAMRRVNDRILRHTPAMPDVPRFRLYNTVGYPAVSGIQVWRVMRKRLLRGANALARSLKLEYGY